MAKQAYQALQAGDADSAISAYNAALDGGGLEPEVRANALLNRALAYQQKGDHQSAVKDYTAALTLDVMASELRATALYNRGLSQQKIGSTTAAIEDFTSALLLNPEFAHAYYSRGNALRDSGQMLFALSDYERAIRYKLPDLSKVYYGEAQTYLALRRPVDARKALEMTLQANPDHEAAKAELAKLTSAADAGTDGDADPILTGSVAALAGGTTATKPSLPKAVDVPGTLQQTAGATAMPKAKAAKKITDRVPSMVQDAALTSTDASAKAEVTTVALADVPAIPEPDAGAPGVEAQSSEEVPAVQPEEKPAELASAEPAAKAKAPAAPAVPSGWMVQIASAASEDAAWSTWKNIQKKHKALEQLKPVVIRADLGAKGVFYRVRLVGFEAQSAAKTACSTLKDNGITCFVSKG
ncbi:MAG: tetratricopeptide repeat protein [Hyphomicrobiales bacterium]